MATDARKSDYITQARQAARDLWNAEQTLLRLQAEWNAQDYGNTMTTDDFEGENAGLTTAQVGAVVFDTANAVNTLVLSIGHATNLTNVL